MTDSQALDTYPFIHDFVVRTEAATNELHAFDLARDIADKYMEDDNRNYEVVCYASVEETDALKQWHFALKVIK